MPIWKNKEKAGVCAPYAHTPASGPLVALLATAALLVLGLGRLLGGLLRGLLVDGRGGRRPRALGHRLRAPLGPGLPALVGLAPALEVAGRERGHGRPRAPRRRALHDRRRRDRPRPHLPSGGGEVPLEDLELPPQRVQERHAVEVRHVPHARAAGDESAELDDGGQLPLRELQLALDLADPQDVPVPRRDLALVHEAPEGTLRQRLDRRNERPERGLDHHLRGHAPPPERILYYFCI